LAKKRYKGGTTEHLGGPQKLHGLQQCGVAALLRKVEKHRCNGDQHHPQGDKQGGEDWAGLAGHPAVSLPSFSSN